MNTPKLVFLFLAKELDAFVDFNVLLTTNVCSFEFVLGHDDSELNLRFSKCECEFDTLLKITHRSYRFSHSR